MSPHTPVLLLPLPLLLSYTAALMSSVYEDHKDEDGFLYITYSGESTFGGLMTAAGSTQEEEEEEAAAAAPSQQLAVLEQ
jgi:hypothetical protein